MFGVKLIGADSYCAGIKALEKQLETKMSSSEDGCRMCKSSDEEQIRKHGRQKLVLERSVKKLFGKLFGRILSIQI